MRTQPPPLNNDFDRDVAIRRLFRIWDKAGPFDAISKRADETRQSSSTLTPDSELFFAVAPNGLYYFRLTVFYDTDAVADFKYGHTGPAGALYYSVIKQTVAAGSPGHLATTLDAAYDTVGTSITATGTRGVVRLEGVIENGPNAGVWQFTWAQDTAVAADTTIHRSSFLEYRTG